MENEKQQPPDLLEAARRAVKEWNDWNNWDDNAPSQEWLEAMESLEAALASTPRPPEAVKADTGALDLEAIARELEIGWRFAQGIAGDRIHARNALWRAIERVEAARLRSLPPESSPSLTCTWSQADADSDLWEATCGIAFCLYEGSPVESGMKFCHGCGKPIEESKHPGYGVDDDEPQSPAPGGASL